MSASDNAAITPRQPGDDVSGISDDDSESSYAGSGAPDTPACPYQSTLFFGQECSRYYDCPTHMVERSATGQDEINGVSAGTSSRSIQAGVTLPQLNGPAEDGASEEDSDTELDRAGFSAPRRTQVSNTEPIRSGNRNSPLRQPTLVPRTEQTATAGAATQGESITFREALHQTQESVGGLSIGSEVPSRSGINTSSSSTEDAGRSTTSLPVPPLETQRPTSSLNPIAPAFTPRPGARPQDISLPRWQPDSEVTFCPICRTQFSFFVRKHHCRKCGRVVCNSCSPHKITIPHQYIVRPPGERAYQRYSFLGDEGGIADFSALGGGEQVRLCNPCVPDPNTTPPQTQHPASQLSPRPTHQRSQSSSSGNYNSENLNRYPQYLMLPNPPPDPYARSRSVTMNSGAGPSRPTHSNYFPPHNRIITGTPPTYYPHPYSGYRYPPHLGPRPPGPSLVDLAGPSSSSSTAAANRPLPPPPQIPEEDECPICHRELPSRDLPDFEARRESHIESCITAHSTYTPGPDASGRPGGHGTPTPRTIRRTGMFPYLATEKDCVDSAECTICLEEFEVGVPMARLECLCRFHRSCITAWFVDHPGRCPVHQHDSFGY
ncbi:FYVE-domain-containing protein [Hypomontagnella submonticulosa]|nr:FYVE-domain-containing protein [Hypomontagnella submonticulosa]